MFERYKSGVELVCVYIQEAHPSDGWQVLMNIDQKVVFEQPKSEDERAAVAEACVLNLKLDMPMVLDRLSNEVDTAYSALPERLYTVDRDGIIVYRSEPGPWGFDLDAFEESLKGQAR